MIKFLNRTGESGYYHSDASGEWLELSGIPLPDGQGFGVQYAEGTIEDGDKIGLSVQSDPNLWAVWIGQWDRGKIRCWSVESIKGEMVGGQAVNITACMTAASFNDLFSLGVGSQLTSTKIKTYLAGNPIKPEPGVLVVVVPDISGIPLWEFAVGEYWTIASDGTTWSTDYGEWRHDASMGDFHLIGNSLELDRPFTRAWVDVFIPNNAPYQEGNYRLVVTDAVNYQNYGPGDQRLVSQGEWITLWCDLQTPSKIKEVKIILGLGGNVDGFRIRNLQFETQNQQP